MAMLQHSHHGRRPLVPAPRRERERGQMLVIFALALVALVGMVGLIIDGGDTFLQRRDQQNVADAAAMAAGYAYANGLSPDAAAQAVAAANGYVNGQGNTTVSVAVGSTSISVDVARPHRNYFSGILGFASWNVSATASVVAGVPNGVYGAMPLIFNKKAFNNSANRDPNAPVSFGEPGSGSNDIPLTASSFNWTVYCTASGSSCNGDSSTVDALINQNGTSTVIDLTYKISPLNAGAHTTLYDSLASKVGVSYPVAIVDDDGKMVGWASFYLTGSVGGSTKQISGYFESEVNPSAFVVTQTGGAAVGIYGAYSVKLVN